MQKVIDISLTGHPAPFRLHEDAYERLRQYLDQARTGMTDDLDQAEVMGDLERSIGDKLSVRLRADHPVIDATDVESVLDEIGAVDAGTAEATVPPVPQGGRANRRFFRIREGQKLAGICTGLAAYAELDVDLVRWTFVLLALVTGGIFLLVYVAAMFFLPVVPTRAAFVAAQGAAGAGQ